MTTHAKLIVAAAVKALDKHLAKEIRVIDVERVTSICDGFVIAHGGSTTQVRALSDYVEKELKEQHGIEPFRVEGYHSSNWVLIDYGEIIVHVFGKETREFYDLERLWKDGTDIDIAEFIDSEEKPQ